MRVLLLITDLLIGGTPTVVRELSWRLRDSGIDVQVACLSKWGKTADQIQGRGVKVTALNARGPWDAIALLRLSRLIRSEQIDVVLSFLIHANVAATIARLAGRPFRLVQSIQTTQPYPRWHWWMQNVIRSAAQAIVVPSEAVAMMAKSRSRIPESKLVVITNAVDASEFAITPKPSVGAFRLGFIGRLDPIKRIPDLLEALKFLPGHVELNIWGAGSERQRLGALAERLGVTRRCHLRGEADRPQDALPEIDLLVLPSDAEGFGLVLIEAMAARIPVVATDVPGIRNVLTHGVDGLLVPARSPAAIADAVEKVMRDHELRKMLVDQADRSVRTKFDWSVVLPRYLHVIKGESST